MKTISHRSKSVWIIPILVFFIILNPIETSAQEDTKTVSLEIKSQTGDRLDTYQTVLKIYQDDIKTPYQIIEFPKNNPVLIESLPIGHTYKIDIFVTGILAETLTITDETEITALIPIQGGIKFEIAYDDGKTPIENASLVIKSNDGRIWNQDTTGVDGKSKRFWMQSNNLVDDYYIAEIAIDQNITYTHTEHITVFPNVQEEIKIITPWPSIVDDLITISVYKDSIKINKSDGKFAVELYDNGNNKVSESIVNHKGEAFFANLKVGQYILKVIEQADNTVTNLTIFPETSVSITGKESAVAIFGTTPIEGPDKTCNCVAFRLDDVQDWFLNTQQIEIMKAFQEKNAPLTLGIIGNFWGEDKSILDFIKEDADSTEPIFEIGNHSWDNNPLPTFDKNDQIIQIQKTNEVIQETLGVTPTTFTAVENKFNEDTKEALQELGFTHFTGHVDEIDTPPYLVKESNLYYLPANTETADLNLLTNNWDKVDYQTTFSEAQDFINKQGFAVVMMHPYEFTETNFEGYTGDTDFEHIESLKKLIDKFRENDIEIVSVGEITENVIDTTNSTETIQKIEGCNCVYFRFVGLQDYWLNDVQIKVIDTFVENNADLTVGVIGNLIGEDVKFVNYLKGIVYKNENIGIANNGWNFDNFSDYSKKQQSEFLAQGNTQIEYLFSISPTIFIPPYDNFNEDTIVAMQENAMSYLSSNIRNDPPPYDTDSEIHHYPGSAATSMWNTELGITQNINHEETFAQIQDSINNNGFAVVTLSPPEFAKIENQVYLNEINESQIQELELLLQKIQENGLEVNPIIERTITVEEIPITVPIDGKISDCDQTFGPFLDFDGCNFTDKIIRQTDLSNTSLVKTTFSGLDIKNVNFANAILVEANFEDTNLTGVSFESADLNKINFSNATLHETNLRETNLSKSNLKNIEYRDSDAKGVNLAGADLTGATLKGVGFTNADFTGAILIESDFSGINLAEAILKESNFENANLTGASLMNTDLSKVILNGADLTDANLKDADLTGADLTGANLNGITLTNAILERANLPGADLTEILLKEVNLSNANLKDVNLSGADLTGADLTGANLNGITLTNAILERANLPGADLTEILLKEVNLSNANLKDVNLSGADLTGANLNGADLTGANLNGADLTGADLTGANLNGITLTNAILERANLPGADLTEILLKEVNLSNANLKDVNLSGADLTGANLNGADLTNANWDNTNFSGADLSNTGLELKDLDTAKTNNDTIVSETGFFFFRELIAFFESLFK